MIDKSKIIINNNVIGNGFIANHFKDFKNYKTIIIFASGISNSKCKSERQFIREFNLLKKTYNQHTKKKIIYFSSCSVLDKTRSSQRYQVHKLNMEKFIKENFQRYLIFRLPELIGSNQNNKKTLLNYFFKQIMSNKKIITSNNVYRNIIDINDVVRSIKHILEKNINNKVINIANPNMYTGIDIVKTFEKVLNKKITYNLNNKIDNEDFTINISYIKKIYSKLNIKFNKNYLYNKINKYYP